MSLRSTNDVWEVVSILTASIVVPDDYMRTDVGDVSGLATSMEELGLLAPILVGFDGEGDSYVLRAGLRRLRAAQMNEWKFVPVLVLPDLDHPLATVETFRDENTQRKPLTPSEAVRVADRIEARVKCMMAERIKAGVKANPVANLPQGATKSRDVAAAAVGMSATTLRSARRLLRLVDTPDLEPEVREQVKEKVELMDSTGNVSRALREATALVHPGEPSQLSLRQAWARAGSATESFVKALDIAVDAMNRDIPGTDAGIEDSDLELVETNARRALELVNQLRKARLQVLSGLEG